MRLRLKTKLTLITALLVLAVVAATSWLYVATMTRQEIRQVDERAQFVAQQVFLGAQHALSDAANEGATPGSSGPEDVREYVRQSLDENQGLTSLVEATLAYSPTIYEVTIVDNHDTVLISSDPALPGRQVLRRTPLSQLLGSSVLEQLRVIFGPLHLQIYEVTFPFNVGSQPFGEIRVATHIGN